MHKMNALVSLLNLYLIFYSAVLNIKDVFVNVRLFSTTNGLHQTDVSVLGLGQRGQIVSLARGVQHWLGLGHFIALEDVDVGMEESHDLFALDLIAADLLDDNVVRGEEEGDKVWKVLQEGGLDVLELAVEAGVGGDPEAGVGEEEALDGREAAPDVLAQILEILVLLLIDFQATADNLKFKTNSLKL